MRYRLMNDYSVAWPFWADDGLCAEHEPALPAPLTDDLRAWAATFNQRFSHVTGWPSETAALQHEREGRRLLEAVQRALPEDSITLEYWETAHQVTAPRANGTVLDGGNMGTVLRFGDVVQRPAGEWTPAVHLLLERLREAGIEQVPEPLGVDVEEDVELVSYIEGEVLEGAAPAVRWSEQVLMDAATLLRGIHDRSLDLVDADLTWRSPRREPAEVICHNDFAPYNLIVRDGALVGAIDFDFAGPGSRLWDLAYLGYRLAPYASDSLEASGLDRERRVRLLLDSYGTDASADRLREVMVEALGALEAHTRARADATGRGELYGHAEMYRTDADAILESLRGG